jgi:CRP-like cAMP-binding protein
LFQYFAELADLEKIGEVSLNEGKMGPKIEIHGIAEGSCQDHPDMWTDLCSVLTVEEGNALYHALKEVSYQGEQAVFIQGKQDSNLYFIKQGQLRILYSNGGREVFLKMLRPGEIVGQDTFFSDSVCTTTATPFSFVRLSYLGRDTLLEWKDKFPSLESKLRAYCLKFEKINDLLLRKGLDRRAHTRFKICGKAIIRVLNACGSMGAETFDVDLWDISASGLSCYVKLSKKETARFLLGCELALELFIPAGEDIRKTTRNGRIVAVRCNPFEHYSLHVKFDQLLDGPFMSEIERFAIAPSAQGR